MQSNGLVLFLLFVDLHPASWGCSDNWNRQGEKKAGMDPVPFAGTNGRKGREFQGVGGSGEGPPTLSGAILTWTHFNQQHKALAFQKIRSLQM